MPKSILYEIMVHELNRIDWESRVCACVCVCRAAILQFSQDQNVPYQWLIRIYIRG